MTDKEIRQVLAIIASGYRNEFKNDDESARNMTASLWKNTLEDYSYLEVTAAIKEFIMTDTKGFAPKIGQIVEIMNRHRYGELMTSGKAWDLIMTAVKNSINNAYGEFKKLPPALQDIVGSAAQLKSMAMMPQDKLQSSTYYAITKEFANGVQSGAITAKSLMIPEPEKLLQEKKGENNE